MKLIHIADVHWGARPEREKPGGKSAQKKSRETFRRVLERAKEQKTDLLLISGDFFERQPSLTDLREAGLSSKAAGSYKNSLDCGKS